MTTSCFILPSFQTSACFFPRCRKPPAAAAGGKGKRLSCECKAGDVDDLVRGLDRRDVLLGLTGVGVGVGATAINLSPALAAEASAPAEKCITALINDKVLKCVSAGGIPCPVPYLEDNVIEFTPHTGPLTRVRRPAHLVAMDEEYVKKYKKGISMMKKLNKEDPDDPRGFDRQAAIHQAYCDHHYKVVTEGGMDLDVHSSSIFAPWHRMYIYFFERIVGELIGDTTFALPYWNWDAPDGMYLPEIFKDVSSPLYNANRNQDHIDAVMVFNRGPVKQKDFGDCSDDDIACVKETNLCIMYRQMAAETAELFHGKKFCAKGIKSGGSLENFAHTAVHIWMGDPKFAEKNKDKDKNKEVQNGQDMGVLGTAARDPAFYSHHANVDRLWHLWTTKLGNKDLLVDEDGGWRDTGFVFYDEKKRPVRITIGDVLDTNNLGYTFQDKDTIEWEHKRPKPCPTIDRSVASQAFTPMTFPVDLIEGTNQYVRVERPKEAQASGGSSKKKPEVLVLDVTIADPCEYEGFKVLVNCPRGQEARVGPLNSEFVALVENLPHGGGDGGMSMGPLVLEYQLPLRELVQDLRCGKDRGLDVTIIPLAGQTTLTVDAVRVKLLT